MASDDHRAYLAMAEQAEKAAMRGQSKTAKRFLVMAAAEYRRLAAEALKREISKGDPSGSP
jgi:rubrerythrin